ncbi:hypothetical protein [Novosphingobium album (ex Hu et al. 2023)]|uniref:Uncharacterized protein n=1 Tax=Novosphingobium album (ex Hu et al. 2023) TaxID=2930093 RepID=A0ABT0AYD4_9SPHN|nr:hypothetical protein [Novosphingobium album (ex Hu et al. 2023)]MCJ2177786.1 hypothetical protein [Novosphingobium album (ex Hu et al. 2023)]
MAAPLLPEGFADLERFVPDWVQPDAVTRMATRQASPIAALREFYDAMLPRGEAVLAHLRHHQLGALAGPEENLLRLMLMLAEVAPAVEWYGDPRVYDGFPVERVRYLRQISDSAAQAFAGEPA